jgi:hypothetical protein
VSISLAKKSVKVTEDSDEKEEASAGARRLPEELSIRSWAAKHQLSQSFAASLADADVTVEALSLMSREDMKSFMEKHSLDEEEHAKDIARAFVHVSQDWLHILKRESELVKSKMSEFAQIEAGLTKSYDACVSEIAVAMDEAESAVKRRRVTLLEECAKGRDGKLSELKKEEIRFRDYVLKLSKALISEKSILEDTQLSAVDKAAKLVRLRDSTIDDRFQHDVGVNSSMLLDTKIGAEAISSLYAIDTCERPEPPQIQGHDLATANAVEIWWEKPESGPKIDKFEVDYTRPENTQWQTIHVQREEVEEKSRFAIVLTHLRYDARYFVRIRAVNEYGVSNNSQTKVVKTKPGAPPPAPTRVIAMVTSGSSIEVNWKMDVSAPDDEDDIDPSRGRMVRAPSLGDKALGASLRSAADDDAVAAGITHYQIQWRQRAKSTWRSGVVSSKDGTNWSIPKVKGGRVYEIHVRARNASDWSEWSETVSCEVRLAGPIPIPMTVVDHRAHYSKSYHPANVLVDDNSNYASAINEEFESEEVDWIVFSCESEFKHITRMQLRQWEDGSDVRRMHVEVTDDLATGAWISAKPTVLTPIKTEDMQTFDLSGVDLGFRFIRVQFEENHGDHDPRSRRFIVNFLRFYGVPE